MLNFFRKKVEKPSEVLQAKKVIPTEQKGGQEKSEKIKAFIKKVRPFKTNFPLIRLGAGRDGGYLVPDDLAGISACFSAGVGRRYSFEKDCFDLGMEIFMADKSVKNPKSIPSEYNFLAKYIGYYNNDEFITMNDWVQQSTKEDSSDLLLQMDIEGAEYYSLLNMSDPTLQRFRVIVIEFHWFRRLWNRQFLHLADAVFEKLLQHHTCVHIHPNNYVPPIEKGGIPIPPLMEFTFLRNDRISERSEAVKFPHPLDRKNVSNKEDYPLPYNWFGE
ncbi:MAG: hypothetical protein ACI94Y_000693 [Maribacter sp.]|jgi:hypothetical protein